MKATKFKSTELGSIPVDWEVKRLGDIGSFKNGISKSAESFGHGVPFVNLLDVFGKSRLTSVYGLGLVEVSHAEIADCGLRQGDTLFVRSSVKPEGVGLATVIDGKLSNTVFSGFLLRYRTDELETGYKRYAFAEANFRQRVIASSTISANTNVNQTVLKKLFVPVPPIAEQRRIAGALSDVDELISALGKLIEKKRNIKTGAMQELLTGKTRLPGFKGKWVEKCIGDMTCVVTGATPSTAREDFWGGSIRWMSSGELNYKIVAEVEGRITKEGFEACSTHIIPVGCVLIGLAGQGKTRGTAAYNLVEMCTNQSIASILPTSSFHSKFLYYYMDRQYDELRLISAGDGGRGGLTKGDIEKFSIRIPPTLAEQQAIAAVLSDMDAEIAALEADRTKYERIKSGMMQELLTGKTRLRGK